MGVDLDPERYRTQIVIVVDCVRDRETWLSEVLEHLPDALDALSDNAALAGFHLGYRLENAKVYVAEGEQQ